MTDKPLTIKRRMSEILLVLGFSTVLLIGGIWILLTKPVIGAIEPAKPLPEVSRDNLRKHVNEIVVGHYPRDYVSIENLNALADYIADEFLASGGRVSVQEYEADGLAYKNIVCLFGPDVGPRVVVGAHYDSAYETPGADDNASGVAGLLELGRMLGENPPASTVELVAWTLEEPPFFTTPEMGSALHAKAHGEAGTDIRLVIALETIGYFSDEPGSQDFPSPLLHLYYPDTGNFIAVVGITSQGGAAARVKKLMCGATDLPVHAIAAPTIIPGIDFSDHRSYWEYGYDSVMVTDTAFFRNKYYHTLSDTPDRLDFDRMSKTVQGVYVAVIAY
jgi:Zn-dependent M28 family amino/carboxypeptidase